MKYVKIDESNPNRLSAQISILLKNYDYRATSLEINEKIYKDLSSRYRKIYSLLNVHKDMNNDIKTRDLLSRLICIKIIETVKFLKLERNFTEYDLKNQIDIHKLESFIEVSEEFQNLLKLLRDNIVDENFKKNIDSNILEIENFLNAILTYAKVSNEYEESKVNIVIGIISIGISMFIIFIIGK